MKAHSEDVSDTDQMRFSSFSALRSAHIELLKRQRANGDSSVFNSGLIVFIRKAQAAGALIDKEIDRQAAQSLLDYWSTRLFRSGEEVPDTLLDNFDPSLSPELYDDQCPYLGLEAFSEEASQFFFGRERILHTLVAHLHTNRLLAVLGPSGSGKSSIVRAGLGTALRNGAIPDSERWTYLPTLIPGSRPLENLARLFSLPGHDEKEWSQQEARNLLEDPQWLLSLADRRSDQSILLIVDQFEELFTLCENPVEKQAFIDNLTALIINPEKEHRVILTLRTDFESQVTTFPDFHDLFEQSIIRVTPLNASELRQTIEEPANLVGLKFEEGVVDQLLKDILGEPAALPLLQFTLFKLWENRERNRVTWEAYRRLGGGRQALANSADEFYAGLIPEDKDAARHILMRLVQPGEGLEFTSYRVLRKSLYDQSPAHDRVKRVTDKLIKAHLLRLTRGKSPADDQIEVAHEALVRNWPKLVEWLDEERDELRKLQRLRLDAQQWQVHGRDESLLIPEALMENVSHLKNLNGLETAYVKASHIAIQKKKDETEAQRQRELEAARKLAESESRRAEDQTRAAILLRKQVRSRTRLMMISIVAGLAAAGTLLIALFQVYIVNNYQRYQTQVSPIAGEALLHKEDQLDLASLLAVKAYKKETSFSSHGALLDFNTLKGFLDARSALFDIIQYSPQLERFLSLHKAEIWSVAFSHDGSRMATGDKSGVIQLWETENWEPLGAPLKAHEKAVWSLAFSQDDRLLASGSADKTVKIWDVETGQKLSTGKTANGEIWSVAFSPLKSLLAVGTTGSKIYLWDLAQPSNARDVDLDLLPTLAFHPERIGTGITSLAFSPDGTLIAAGTQNGKTALWDLGKNAENFSVNMIEGFDSQEPGQSVWSVVFSPDGRFLAAAGQSYTVRMIGFADGVHTFTSGLDWSILESRIYSQTLQAHLDWVYSIAFSPNGKTLAAGSRDHTISIWNYISNPLNKNLWVLAKRLQGHGQAVVSLAFKDHSNGDILVSGGNDRKVIVWDLGVTSPLAWTESDPIQPDFSTTLSVAGSPAIAEGSINYRIVSGTLILTDTQSDKRFGTPLLGYETPPYSVALSRDRKNLATSICEDYDNNQQCSTEVRLFDVDSGKQIGPPLKPPLPKSGAQDKVAFSSDGRALFVYIPDKPASAFWWDIDPQDWLQTACRIANRDLSPSEWEQYFADEPYQKTCNQ